MKDNDLLILAGCGLAAYLLLGKKTTAATTSGGGGTTLLSQFPDMGWLSGIIPENSLPSISFDTGEGNLLDPFLRIFEGIIPTLPGVPEPTPPPVATPVNPEDLGGKVPTSRTGLSLQSDWGEVIKGIILNMSPQTANLLLGAGGLTTAAGITGGGIYAAKTLYPGARAAFTGFGDRIAQFWRGLGMKGGGGMGSAGLGLALTPGMMQGFGTSNLVLDLFSQGDIIGGLRTFITGPPVVGTSPGVTIRGEGVVVAPPIPGATGPATPLAPYGQFGPYLKGGAYPITDRSMKAGDAPAAGQGYDTKGYSKANAQSSKKPLGGGLSIAEAASSPAPSGTALTAWGSAYAQMYARAGS